LKSEFFEALRHLNRGFGGALSSLDRLQRKDRLHQPSIFPRDCLSNYHNRTEALRSLANRDLLRFLAGREDQDAGRFGRPFLVCGAHVGGLTFVSHQRRVEVERVFFLSFQIP
jgi:hypothetical protein